MCSPSPLLEALDDVGAAVGVAGHVLVLLDFDGTLAPIVDAPELARVHDRARAAVVRLALRPSCTVGIVSGRALDDVRARVGIEGLVYAGNHGLEITGRGLCFDEARAARLAGAVARAVRDLQAGVRHIAGALVEPKRLTASVHYRRVRPPDRDEVERVVRRVVPADAPGLVVVPGQMVWEVRPRVPWNKGTAVRWIRERLGLAKALTVYLGDDRTDEDAFAALGPFVTARVGAPVPTRAGYRVADTDEVAEFLEWLSRTIAFPGPSDAVSAAN